MIAQRELLAADVCLAVGDQTGQRLAQGIERAVPRCTAQHLVDRVEAIAAVLNPDAVPGARRPLRHNITSSVSRAR